MASDNIEGETPAGLHERLELYQTENDDVFAGVGHHTPWGRVFGGQVLAQALLAARRTVPEELKTHSLHGYFLLAGEGGVALLFEVERVRDGRSFATRVVKVKQGSNAIFQMTVSFHRDEEGFSFQTPGRELAAIGLSRGLKSVPSAQSLIDGGAKIDRTSYADLTHVTQSVLVAEGKWWCLAWKRHRRQLPDEFNCVALAWMSDGGMVNTVRKPHGDEDVGMSMSLDHSIHFHRPFRSDDWLLFHTRTTVSAGSRGLARTEVFSLGGLLVATITQEALVRPKKKLLDVSLPALPLAKL